MRHSLPVLRNATPAKCDVLPALRDVTVAKHDVSVLLHDPTELSNKPFIFCLIRLPYAYGREVADNICMLLSSRLSES